MRPSLLLHQPIHKALVVLVLAFTAMPHAAQAYVDPNASNLLFQIGAPILTVIAAGIVFLKQTVAKWLRRVGALFRGSVVVADRRQDDGTDSSV
jgi:hypothetical protein